MLITEAEDKKAESEIRSTPDSETFLLSKYSVPWPTGH